MKRKLKSFILLFILFLTFIIITINFVAIEFCYRIDFTDRNFSMPLFFTLCSASTTPHNVLWKYYLFMQITFIELLKWQSIQSASWYNQQLKINFIFFYSEFHVFPFFFFLKPLATIKSSINNISIHLPCICIHQA